MSLKNLAAQNKKAIRTLGMAQVYYDKAFETATHLNYKIDKKVQSRYCNIAAP